MKKTNKVISCALGVIMSVAAFAQIPITSAKDITVEFDGKELSFDVSPQIISGYTMLPLRTVFEEIGALVKWDNDTHTVHARKSSKTITITIDSNELCIDKGETDGDGNSITEKVELEVPPQIVSGRTLIPLSAVSEAFGFLVDWDDVEEKVTINSDNDSDDTWKENTGTIDLSNLTYSGNGVEINENQILITEGGDFTFKGTLTDGNIKISAKDKVKLRLDGVTITSANDACIFIEDADKAYITLNKDTENTLVAESSENGAIYAKDNLEIKGGGMLTVSSATGHAIKASDNLTIENGTINLTAFGDGIHVNDTFKMTGGNLKISAQGDGIDSESIVIISGGKIDIETTAEPIVSENSAQIAENAENEQQMHRGGMREENTDVEFEKSSKGINAEWMISISSGEIKIDSASHAIHCQDEIEINGGSFNLSSKYEKGISAHGNLTVSNSDTLIDVTKSTEGLESKKTATINDGTIKIISSDDGINATGGKSGEMPGGGPGFGGGNSPDRHEDFGKRENRLENAQEKNQPPEFKEYKRTDGDFGGFGGGMPPQMPEFENGAMPPEMPNDMFPGEMGSKMSDCLVINGGNIEICSGDDCLDSNGNLIINGGTIKAVKEDGTFTGPNSILDADGKISVNEGATLIIAGRGGTQGVLNIPQNSITIYSEKSHSEGEPVVLKDENGNVIDEYTPTGGYGAVLITSPEIETGKEYTLILGDETYTVTISEQNISIGTQKSDNFGRRNPTVN